jgi:hypothetical protein
MADVVLSTVDLDVYGGPSAIDVSVDFGETGARGSRIWAGNGDPVIYLAGQDIKLYDWYINTNTTETYYSWMYQYVLEVGSPTWVPVLQLNPSQFSTIASVSFTTGVGTTNIPISNLTTNVGTVVSDYIIRFSFSHPTVPLAGSVDPTISGTNLALSFLVVDANTGTLFDGITDVHLFISYKN